MGAERGYADSKIFFLKAAVLGNQIFVIGGQADGKNLVTVEAYDTQKGTWSKKADLLSSNECLGAAAANGKIYAFIEGDSEKTKGTVEEYDPAANSWSIKSDMASERHNTAFVAFNDKIYAVGGLIHVENPGEGDNIAKFRNLNTVEEYDTITGKWTSRASMKTARHALAVAASGGRIYSLGGSVTDQSGNDGPTNVVEEYDPTADKWTVKNNLIVPMAYHTVCELNGKVYITGGSALKNMFAEYNPSDSKWTNKKARSVSSWQNCSVALDGKIFVIGGTSDFSENPKALNILEVYDPELDK